VWLEGLGKLKKFKDLTGTRTRHLQQSKIIEKRRKKRRENSTITILFLCQKGKTTLVLN
jgi:hypothetical protein